MKKIFLALSVLAMVAFVAVPCQALVGMPDAVPGSKTIIPFWIVDINFAGNTTLVTLTEVEGVPATSDPVLDDPGALHLKVYNKRSKIVHDQIIPYTKFDVVGIDFGQVIKDNFGQAAKDDCAIDFDGNGTDDHFLGYATVEDLNYYYMDHWIAHLYQLDLGGGLAAGVVIPVQENNSMRCSSANRDFPSLLFSGYESFNADAYFSAEQMIAGLPCGNAGWFRFMPRYYVHDATGESYLILWQSQNLYIPLGAVQPYTVGGTMHIYWFDEEEHKYSADLDIPNEVNVIDITYWLPGAHMGDFPWAGWFDMSMPGSFIGGTPWTTETEMLAYSWQMAQGAASQSWSVLFEVHRDAGTDVQLTG